MRKRQEYHPKENQKNPDNLTTNNVQVWHHGVMAGIIKLEDAKEMVKNHNAFVITQQAIGTMKDGISTS